ncbi:hypothetical protein BDZ45DRAFT_676230 [Acephala macrosclerotiorum]|nr:hypothetical protein BDZ45DRAFT_676230 [Acephala macrosclerotiorum]
MPLYSFHTNPKTNLGANGRDFHAQVVTLHCQNFKCDPDSVRTELIGTNAGGDSSISSGGYGYKPPKNSFSYSVNSEFLIVSMDFRGTAEEWQDYCRKLVKFRRGELRSIYLQRNEFEFEVHDVKLPGWIIRPEELGGASVEKGKGVELPAYEK